MKPESRNLIVAVIVIAVGGIAVLAALAYMVMNSIEDEKIERANQETSRKLDETLKSAKESSKESQNKISLAECLDNAQKSYEKNWNSESASLGMNGKLPMDLADLHDKRLESSKDTCYILHN
jgi:hypothetical protein